MQAMPAILRILLDPALDGPTNMARDEALLESVGRPGAPGPFTLRLYQWSPPTISLGYFQPYADYEALEPPARELTVVRRPTGGGAILHDQELTYSLALPIDHPLLGSGPNRLYESAHDAVIAALAELNVEARRGGVTDNSGPRRGPFFCFARRHAFDVLLAGCHNRVAPDDPSEPPTPMGGDVRALKTCAGHPALAGGVLSSLGPVDGQKIAGSAQRRTRRAVLQHGSIVLAVRYPQQPAAVLPLPMDAATFGARFAAAFTRLSCLESTAGVWSRSELHAADRLVAKYAGDEWMRRA
ncbi:MAG TPA: hypothetical protein VGM03_08770 [Phycisphaerae bacterium]